MIGTRDLAADRHMRWLRRSCCIMHKDDDGYPFTPFSFCVLALLAVPLSLAPKQLRARDILYPVTGEACAVSLSL